MGDGCENIPLIETNGRASTCYQTLGNVVVSVLGTGALGVPFAFRVAGWLSASVCLLLIAVAVSYCMLLLVRCRKRLEEDGEEELLTTSDVGSKAFGKAGRTITDLLILTSHAGGSVAFFLFIGENLSNLIPNITPSLFILLLVLPLEIALSFIRSLSFLAPFSLFATFCNVSAMAAVINQDIQELGNAKHPLVAYNGVGGVIFACGVALYCFEGLGMTLPLEGSMKERRKFGWVLVPSMFGIAVAYVAFGAFGYAAFGEDTKEIVSLNLSDNWSAVLVKVGLCTAITFTLPIAVHPIHEIIDTKLKSSEWYRKLCNKSQTRYWLGSQLARITVMTVFALLATSVPGFMQLVSFVGMTVCSMMCFVLPASFHLKIMGSSLSLLQKFADYFLLIVGSIFAVYGTYVAVLGNPL